MINVKPMSHHEYYKIPKGKVKRRSPDVPGYQIVDQYGPHWWPKARFEELWNEMVNGVCRE